MKQSPKTSSLHLFIATTVIVLLVTILTFLSIVWLQNRALKQELSNLTTWAHYGMDQRDTQPVVDAEAKRVYWPGLNAYLPLSVSTLDITYRITDYQGGNTTDVVVASKTNSHIVASIPGLREECQEPLRLEFGATTAKPRSNETSLEPFTLADGRTVYMYGNDYDECKQYFAVSAGEAENIIRQLRSY